MKVDSIDQKIRKLDAELITYKERMAKLPDGPSKSSLKQQAMRILQQKKQYENQKMAMMNQSLNLESTSFAVSNLRTTVTTVDAMQQASREMKAVQKQLDIDRVENLRDEVEEMMFDAAEVQEVLGRSYGTMDFVDEADLEAELGALGEEAFADLEAPSNNSVPSYLAEIETPATKQKIGMNN